MKCSILLVAVSACGRIGFDPTRGDGGPDGPSDGQVPFVDPVGMLDPAFGTGGQTVLVRDTDDAKMFDVQPRPGGYFSYGRVVNAGSRGQLLAWTRDGQLDPTFSNDGVEEYSIESSDYGYGVLPLRDGRFLLAGDGFRATLGDDDMLFGMISATGTIDPAFGSGLLYFDLAKADTAYRAIETSRGLVACGVTDRGVTDSHHVLLGLLLTGVRDQGFGVGGLVTDDSGPGTDTCYDLVLDAGGGIVTAGTSATSQIVTRYDALGARDIAFATGGRHTLEVSGEGRAIAIAGDQDLVVVGYGADGGYITRFSPDGTPRAGFGQNGIATIAGVAFYDVAVQPNGKIVAVGDRKDGMSNRDGVVVRLLADGTLDPTFGTGGMIVLDVSPDDTLSAVHVESGGVIAVGSTETAGVAHAWIVRLR